MSLAAAPRMGELQISLSLATMSVLAFARRSFADETIPPAERFRRTSAARGEPAANMPIPHHLSFPRIFQPHVTGTQKEEEA
jgi:hypothetical protein